MVTFGTSARGAGKSADEGIQHRLHIDSFHSFGKASEYHFPLVSFAITVSIFEVQNVGTRGDKDAALQRAQELFDTTDDLCLGVVTVRKQVVDWFYEEDGIAGWEETDEEIDIV